MLEMEIEKKKSLAGVAIKVMGVGGGGNNAVNRMIESDMREVEFIAVNTDNQVLLQSRAVNKLQIGNKLTMGRGTGGKPQIGEKAAEESRDELLAALKGAEVVFITAGMGGGTGTGASPIIAACAKEVGALTVAVVTKPFAIEGEPRSERAEEGIRKLAEKVDTIIVIPNEKLIQATGEDTTMFEAFSMADDVLCQAVNGMLDIILNTGLINVDFNDVRGIMSNAGAAFMVMGFGKSAESSLAAAIKSPLLDISLAGATGVLLNFTGSKKLNIHDVNKAAKIIQDIVDKKAEIYLGVVLNDELEENVRVTVFATGFKTKAPVAPRQIRLPGFMDDFIKSKPQEGSGNPFFDFAVAKGKGCGIE